MYDCVIFTDFVFPVLFSAVLLEYFEFVPRPAHYRLLRFSSKHKKVFSQHEHFFERGVSS